MNTSRRREERHPGRETDALINSQSMAVIDWSRRGLLLGAPEDALSALKVGDTVAVSFNGVERHARVVDNRPPDRLAVEFDSLLDEDEPERITRSVLVAALSRL
jgi:hypothetical protein